MAIDEDGDDLKPVHGELVTCEMCHTKYEYFVWSLGNDACLCRTCVHKRPQAHLDDDRLETEDPYMKDLREGNLEVEPAAKRSQLKMLLGHPAHPLTKGTRRSN